MSNLKKIVAVMLTALMIFSLLTAGTSAFATSETAVIAAFEFDSTGKNPGDKLDEYGSKSGYSATTGEGTLICSVNESGTRAIEWSAAEYGEGTDIVPLMTAGSKNPWGEQPHVDIVISTKDFENIAISLVSAGSKKCPATWQLSYSTDDEAFTDIEGAEYTISLDNRKLPTAYFDGLSLPEAVSDLDTVTLRLYAVSTVTVSGGSTTDDPTGGEFVINNIVVTGDKIVTDETTPDETTPEETTPDESTPDETTPEETTPEETTPEETTPDESTPDESTPDESTPDETYILGDANSDGKVNIKDATYIQKYLADLIDTIDEETADCNKDGKVNVKDATAIQKFLADLPTNNDIGAEMIRK